MAKERSFGKITINCKGVEVVLEEISATETAGKKRLGTAYGTDIHHCVYLMAKYAKRDFQNGVGWYYLNPEQDTDLIELQRDYDQTRLQTKAIRVEFYTSLTDEKNR